MRTPRLLLREFRMSDFDAFAANLADPLATASLDGVVNRRVAWRIFGSGMGSWMLNGSGWWGIELVEIGALVGTVGAFFRESGGDLELGWTVYRSFWRQGIATEAAAAALELGLERHKVSRAIAHVSKANLPSVRVTERLGMRYEGEVDFYGEPTGRYAIER